MIEAMEDVVSPVPQPPSWTPSESDIFGLAMHKLLVL